MDTFTILHIGAWLDAGNEEEKAYTSEEKNKHNLTKLTQTHTKKIQLIILSNSQKTEYLFFSKNMNSCGIHIAVIKFEGPLPFLWHKHDL